MMPPIQPQRPPRKRPGRIDPDRPLPEPMLVATEFPVPDRLARDGRLSLAAHRLAVVLCMEARADRVEVAPGNARLLLLTRLKATALKRALAELERCKYVYRVLKGDAFALDNLHLAGYADPYAGRPGDRPRRCLVLLWRLPKLSQALKEVAPRRPGSMAPRRQISEGGDS